MAVIELVRVAEKAVITGGRTTLIPARHLVAGHLVKMQKPEGGPRGTVLRIEPVSEFVGAVA